MICTDVISCDLGMYHVLTKIYIVNSLDVDKNYVFFCILDNFNDFDLLYSLEILYSLKTLDVIDVFNNFKVFNSLKVLDGLDLLILEYMTSFF